MKRFVLIGICVALIASSVIFLYPKKTSPQISFGEGKVPVTASIYPVSFFAKHIGGEKITVNTIAPVGVEPHDFDPKPGDLASLYSSKLLILNGANLEPWAEKITSDLQNKGIVVAKASDNVELIIKEGQPDPHFWLDPVSAQRMVLNIRDALIKVSPENEAYYRSNADSLIVKLIALDNSYKKSLFSCSQDTVVTSHNVFGYLEDRYKFKQETISGISPEEEPSSQRLAELVTLIKQKNIKVILTEILLSPKVSETIAREAGVRVQTFNPLESLTQEELSRGEDYFTIQDVNLMTLISALECTPT